jgi:hypothetical protein
MKLAALILVSVGAVGLVASLILSKRKLEQLRRLREEGRR